MQCIVQVDLVENDEKSKSARTFIQALIINWSKKSHNVVLYKLFKSFLVHDFNWNSLWIMGYQRIIEFLWIISILQFEKTFRLLEA